MYLFPPLVWHRESESQQMVRSDYYSPNKQKVNKQITTRFIVNPLPRHYMAYGGGSNNNGTAISAHAEHDVRQALRRPHSYPGLCAGEIFCNKYQLKLSVTLSGFFLFRLVFYFLFSTNCCCEIAFSRRRSPIIADRLVQRTVVERYSSLIGGEIVATLNNTSINDPAFLTWRRTTQEISLSAVSRVECLTSYPPAALGLGPN